MASAID
jgi:hypothetical protein